MKLYNFTLSGNCQKIRMILAMLGIDYETQNIDLLDKEQMSPEFVEVNPLHKVPVIDDDGFLLRDSAAILIYLARKYGRSEWHPEDPAEIAEIQQWLSFSVNEVFNGFAIARALIIFKREGDHEAAVELSRQSLDVMERHLKNHDWLALDRMTIADIACYPYTALIEEGNVSLDPYPAVRAWIARVEALPGYVAMPGLPFST